MIKENRIIGIFGRTGSGKSYIANSLLNEFKNYIIWDYQKEYNLQGSETFENFNTFIDSLRLALKKKRDIKFILRLDIKYFILVCAAVSYVKNCLFFIEELDIVTKSNSPDPEFLELIRSGRHNSLSVMYTTRRPAEIPRLVTSQTREVYVFKFTEPRDLEYIQKYLNVPSGKVRNLSLYEKLYVKL